MIKYDSREFSIFNTIVVIVCICSMTTNYCATQSTLDKISIRALVVISIVIFISHLYHVLYLDKHKAKPLRYTNEYSMLKDFMQFGFKVKNVEMLYKGHTLVYLEKSGYYGTERKILALRDVDVLKVFDDYNKLHYGEKK